MRGIKSLCVFFRNLRTAIYSYLFFCVYRALQLSLDTNTEKDPSEGQ